MTTSKDKQISKIFETIDTKNFPIKNSEPDIFLEKKSKSKIQNEISATSQTEAQVNITTILNKLTLPNFIDATLTLGGCYATSLLGVGIGTGLGLAIGGPAGAIIGYHYGNITGIGLGAIGGHKFGKIVKDKLKNDEQKNIIEYGMTNINIDTKTKVNMENERKNR